MAWFGGAYEGAEDVAIWTAKRAPSGGAVQVVIIWRR
jgi:hypothetical protein